MKRMIYGLVLATAVAFTGGCEKENPLGGKKPAVPSGEKTIPVFALSASFNCGGWVCNAVDLIPNPKYNMLIMSSASKQIPPVTYTLYERSYVNGNVEVYVPFDQFTCSDGVTHYANGLVNNNVKVLVIGTDAAYPVPGPTDNVVLISGVLYPGIAQSSYHTVTTGNYKGQSCLASED